MIIKTSELSGLALDWAVAKCEGEQIVLDDHEYCIKVWHGEERLSYETLAYSRSWSKGGPIIERESISLHELGDYWKATRRFSNSEEDAPTPLIAAMRCYVASKLGDEVEIPESL